MEIGSLKTDHEALADAVHEMLGRLLMIESRMEFLEKFVRDDAAAQNKVNEQLSSIVKGTSRAIDLLRACIVEQDAIQTLRHENRCLEQKISNERNRS